MSNFDHKIYKKTGYKITFEPIKEELPAVRKILINLHDEVIENNSLTTANKLEKLVVDYPTVPAFKNYLYNSYIQLKKKDLAEKTLNLTIDIHPDYLFAKLNKAQNFIDKKKFGEVKSILGENLEINDIVDSRKVLHFSEFINYYETVGMWHYEQDDLDRAEDCFNKMYEVDQSHEKTVRLGRKILTKRMMAVSTYSDYLRTWVVKTFPKKKYEKRKKSPTFNHTEIELLYQSSFEDMNKDWIEIILSLPRQTLIEDLENVLEDAIYRYDFFKKKEWDNNSNFFSLHAIIFLCHLKSVESLPKISDYLSQGEEFLEYWLGDFITEDLNYAFPMIGLNIALLPELKTLVLERNVYTYAKTIYISFAEQIALHQPENRGIVLAWFEGILREILANQEDKNLIDTSLILNLLSTLIDLRATELNDLFRQTLETFPELNKEFDDWEENINLVNDPYQIQPIPLDLEDFYTGNFKKRRAKSNRIVKNFLNSDKPNYLMDLVLNSLSETNNNELGYSNNKPQTPILNETKISRNDPCFCGSGKKYKKCHGE